MPNQLFEYDSILIVSFGGPEGREDVLPFLRNVLAGKNVPEQRMLEVAEHYYHFDGVSPLNQQNRDLIAALSIELAEHNIRLPIYFGNRNWNPMLADTLREMEQNGHRRTLAFFTSAYSSYSGCRQYREDIAKARELVGESAPEVDKLRVFFNHPWFVEAAADRVSEAIERFENSPSDPCVLFTAHSIPMSMSEGCNYVAQLQESSRLVAEKIQIKNWKLVFQSRSGPPHLPWLEPDVCDYIHQLNQEKVSEIVVMPIGFLSDHMEVMFDLDVEAKEACQEAGIEFQRAGSVGTHPRFVSMIRDLIEERIASREKKTIGSLPASHDICPKNCCLSGRQNNA